ncbi:MAG: ABC transporter permease [Chloroflexota bacterium]|nr:ABC transporter permease [Chloroflexota bacterium]
MNPLSPFTYYRRHKRSALLLVALITLATMVLYTIVGVLDSITLQLDFSYLSRLSRVRPDTGQALEPGVIPQIQAHPDVARVIWDNGLAISVPTLGGIDAMHLMGVSQDDVQYLMERCGVRLKEGRLLEPSTNEFMLSEETARALDLELGDRIGRSIDASYYENVLEPLLLVGILEGDPLPSSEPSVRVGFVSYEYLEGHELYIPRVASALVVARDSRKEAVDEFLETAIASARTEVDTYRDVVEVAAQARRFLYLTFGVVNCLVGVAVAVVVGVVNQIALMQRVSEIGLLNALGHHRNKLIRRLTLETAAVAGVGWVSGLSLGLLILSWLKANLYYARGMELDLSNLMPLWFVIPVPLIVVVLAVFSLLRLFARFDAVAIVERGKLSMEDTGSRKQRAKRSSGRPLSSWTFYLRHRRRGIVLVVSAALVIVGVALPVFLLSAVADAMVPDFEYLRYVSRVTPNSGRTVDAGVMGQIRSHPSVERVIPVMSLGLQVDVPPSGVMRASVYGAAEGDLPDLVDLFGMDVKEGRLPNPRSNEIVLSEPVALNRGLHVGDRIGVPAYEKGEFELMDVDDVPTEMVVVGILRQAQDKSLRPRAERSRLGQTLSSDTMWLGLASYEYLESHELASTRPIHLLVVPAGGRKNELDDWLEESVASAQTNVTTYDIEYREHRGIVQGLILGFSVVGCVTAIVAAIAMATLNYIFFTQRREEFGILHAVGRSRLWLVLRTMKETGSMITVAWLAGAVICCIGLICFQALVFAPKGLSLNFLNPVPWVLTFPIPLAVVVASTGTIGRMLSRLDPVAVIERRS